MAQYKVPQDVEADDKLLGPFSFRQFIYLMIAGGLIALAVGLFQLFPLLAIIPVPFALLLIILALPLKKDQPMETYLAAIVSYYLKPRTRRWMPGQRESTIEISAPKKKEESRTRDITGEEATHRLSFLADIVDTEGYAIKGAGVRKISDELVAEANAANDIFENNYFDSLESAIVKDENERHEKVMQEMRAAIENGGTVGGDGGFASGNVSSSASIDTQNTNSNQTTDYVDRGDEPNFASSVVVQPGEMDEGENIKTSNQVQKPEKKDSQIMAKPSIIDLANNTDYSVATISKEAKRLKERDEGEVFISLH